MWRTTILQVKLEYTESHKSPTHSNNCYVDRIRSSSDPSLAQLTDSEETTTNVQLSVQEISTKPNKFEKAPGCPEPAGTESIEEQKSRALTDIEFINNEILALSSKASGCKSCCPRIDSLTSETASFSRQLRKSLQVLDDTVPRPANVPKQTVQQRTAARLARDDPLVSSNAVLADPPWDYGPDHPKSAYPPLDPYRPKKRLKLKRVMKKPASECYNFEKESIRATRKIVKSLLHKPKAAAELTYKILKEIDDGILYTMQDYLATDEAKAEGITPDNYKEFTMYAGQLTVYKEGSDSTPIRLVMNPAQRVANSNETVNRNIGFSGNLVASLRPTYFRQNLSPQWACGDLEAFYLKTILNAKGALMNTMYLQKNSEGKPCLSGDSSLELIECVKRCPAFGSADSGCHAQLALSSTPSLYQEFFPNGKSKIPDYLIDMVTEDIRLSFVDDLAITVSLKEISEEQRVNPPPEGADRLQAWRDAANRLLQKKIYIISIILDYFGYSFKGISVPGNIALEKQVNRNPLMLCSRPKLPRDTSRPDPKQVFLESSGSARLMEPKPKSDKDQPPYLGMAINRQDKIGMKKRDLAVGRKRAGIANPEKTFRTLDQLNTYFSKKSFTMREFLSYIQQDYNPTGNLNGMTRFIGKTIFKQVLLDITEKDPQLKSNKKWNDYTHNRFKTLAIKYFELFTSACEQELDRYALVECPLEDIRVGIICLCDGGGQSSGELIYLKSVDVQTGNTKVYLLSSNSKQAPTVGRTIPQMELDAAERGSTLMVEVLKALLATGIAPSQLTYILQCIDSQSTLIQIRKHADTLPIGVKRQVAIIQINYAEMSILLNQQRWPNTYYNTVWIDQFQTLGPDNIPSTNYADHLTKTDLVQTPVSEWIANWNECTSGGWINLQEKHWAHLVNAFEEPVNVKIEERILDESNQDAAEQGLPDEDAEVNATPMQLFSEDKDELELRRVNKRLQRKAARDYKKYRSIDVLRAKVFNINHGTIDEEFEANPDAVNSRDGFHSVAILFQSFGQDTAEELLAAERRSNHSTEVIVSAATAATDPQDVNKINENNQFDEISNIDEVKENNGPDPLFLTKALKIGEVKPERLRPLVPGEKNEGVLRSRYRSAGIVVLSAQKWLSQSRKNRPRNTPYGVLSPPNCSPPSLPTLGGPTIELTTSESGMPSAHIESSNHDEPVVSTGCSPLPPYGVLAAPMQLRPLPPTRQAVGQPPNRPPAVKHGDLCSLEYRHTLERIGLWAITAENCAAVGEFRQSSANKLMSNLLPRSVWDWSKNEPKEIPVLIGRETRVFKHPHLNVQPDGSSPFIIRLLQAQSPLATHLIHAAHNEMGCALDKATYTNYLLRTGFGWNSMQAACHKFREDCPACIIYVAAMRNNANEVKAPGADYTVRSSLGDNPMNLVCMDETGPIKLQNKKTVHGLIVVEVVTGRVIILAIPDTTTATLLAALLRLQALRGGLNTVIMDPLPSHQVIANASSVASSGNFLRSKFQDSKVRAKMHDMDVRIKITGSNAHHQASHAEHNVKNVKIFTYNVLRNMVISDGLKLQHLFDMMCGTFNDRFRFVDNEGYIHTANSFAQAAVQVSTTDKKDLTKLPNTKNKKIQYDVEKVATESRRLLTIFASQYLNRLLAWQLTKFGKDPPLAKGDVVVVSDLITMHDYTSSRRAIGIVTDITKDGQQCELRMTRKKNGPKRQPMFKHRKHLLLLVRGADTHHRPMFLDPLGDNNVAEFMAQPTIDINSRFFEAGLDQLPCLTAAEQRVTEFMEPQEILNEADFLDPFLIATAIQPEVPVLKNRLVPLEPAEQPQDVGADHAVPGADAPAVPEQPHLQPNGPAKEPVQHAVPHAPPRVPAHAAGPAGLPDPDEPAALNNDRTDYANVRPQRMRRRPNFFGIEQT